MRRRDLIGALAMLPVVTTARARSRASARPPIVLVHGAWHGGWCWREVQSALAAQGWHSTAATLTGMGEREHLGRPDTGLSIHAQDIVAHVLSEELEDAVLVLHSYAGLPGTIAADRLAGRLRGVIYLDALLQPPGRSMLDGHSPAEVATARRQLIDGFRMPPPPPETFGVDPTHPRYAWVKRRLTTFPFQGLADTMPEHSAAFDAMPKWYIAAGRSTLPDSHASRQLAQALGWRLRMIDTGHDAMILAPRPLASLIASLAKVMRPAGAL